MENNVLVTICARGGSKGIPGKNIKPVGGKPLILFSIETARKFAGKHGAEIALSTDSEKIMETAAKSGLATAYRRPDFLANDTCGKVDAIKDVVEFHEKERGRRYDFVIDLDVTSPIRTLEDIENCLSTIKANEEALTVFSVNPCGRNPYFNMVERKDNGFFNVVCQGRFDSRQAAPKVYDMNASIYVYRRQALDAEHPRAVTDRSLVYVMDHICFDLDEPGDYDYLEYLVSSGKIRL